MGRFQPFHLGHLEAVKHILTQVGEIVIVVGSPQQSHTLENPFTAGERITMIRLALRGAGVNSDCYSVMPLPDAEFHKVWVAHLLSQIPEFQIAFTNEPLTGRLLKEAGLKVEKIPFHQRDTYTATEVRRRMLNSEDWEALLPKNVGAFLRTIGAVERMRDLSASDKTT